MVVATDVKEGMTLRLDGKLWGVRQVVRHSGSGQMHGFIELKLRDILFGHFADRRFKQSDKLEDVEMKKRQMEYIFSDAEFCYFMDPETFEQVGVAKTSIGRLERLLKEGTRIIVELLGEEAVGVQFPKVVELKVETTGPGIRDGQDNTMKPAVLENGIDVLVPQFIEAGDRVRIDTDKIKYIDRITTKRI